MSKRQRHQRKIVDRDKHLCDCCHYYRSFTLAKSGYTVFTYDDGTLLTHEEFTELIAKALPFYRLSEEDRADALYLASGGPVQGQ